MSIVAKKKVHAKPGKFGGTQTKPEREDRMDSQIVAAFCLCDDILKALHHYEDHQSQTCDAEVMTTTIVAVLFFGGNIDKARNLLLEYSYMPKMLGRNRLRGAAVAIRRLSLR
jgi:hypothetical protein